MIRNREELYNRVVAITAEVLEIEEHVIKPESRFIEDLGADSIEIAEMIMYIEEDMSGPVDKTGLLEVKTVQETVEAFAKHIEEAKVS